MSASILASPPDAHLISEDIEQKFQILQKIQKVEKLPFDWNGPRTKQLSPISVQNAKTFVNVLVHCATGKKLPIPAIGPTSSGGLSFEWLGIDTGHRELVIFFQPDGTLDYVAANDSADYEISGNTANFFDSHLLAQIAWLINA